MTTAEKTVQKKRPKKVDDEPRSFTLTIRGVDAVIKEKLKIRAERNGRSMEAEVRKIIEEAVLPVRVGGDFRQLSQRHGGFDDLADILDQEVEERRGERP